MKVAELTNAPAWLKLATVIDEDVEINEHGIVTWNSGQFKGVWYGGDWKSGRFWGTWLTGRFFEGFFGGTFVNGTFFGGEFGMLDTSSRINAKFVQGYFKGGTFHMGSEMLGGTFEGGELLGTVTGGAIEGGKINGNVSPGVFIRWSSVQVDEFADIMSVSGMSIDDTVPKDKIPESAYVGMITPWKMRYRAEARKLRIGCKTATMYAWDRFFADPKQTLSTARWREKFKYIKASYMAMRAYLIEVHGPEILESRHGGDDFSPF